MRQEGRAGKYMCRYIVHSMWEDVEQRSKIMGVSSAGTPVRPHMTSFHSVVETPSSAGTFSSGLRVSGNWNQMIQLPSGHMTWDV